MAVLQPQTNTLSRHQKPHSRPNSSPVQSITSYEPKSTIPISTKETLIPSTRKKVHRLTGAKTPQPQCRERPSDPPRSENRKPLPRRAQIMINYTVLLLLLPLLLHITYHVLRTDIPEPPNRIKRLEQQLLFPTSALGQQHSRAPFVPGGVKSDLKNLFFFSSKVWMSCPKNPSSPSKLSSAQLSSAQLSSGFLRG